MTTSDDMDVYPYSFEGTLQFPLALFESVPIADAQSKSGERFVVVAGLDRHMAEQVKHYSLDENDADLQENTSDKKRFGEGSYEEWYSKGRTPFALIHEESDSVTAICWFGPKPLGQKSMKYLSDEEREAGKKIDAENWHTISYRSYNPFRGKGHMRGFVQFCIDTYLKAYPDAKLWAIFNSKNEGSIGLAQKLGFPPRPDASHPEEHLVTMVRE
ncbi:GNAT family N-acetyltransferase [Patescibacteria group bacterium]|nr:GNAT family N-acetyltransferase [Patescibacteria group bacterium]